jgi:hypothetical protein
VDVERCRRGVWRVATRLRRGGDSTLRPDDVATEHERMQSQSRSCARCREGRRTPQPFRIDVGEWGGVMAADPDRPSDFDYYMFPKHSPFFPSCSHSLLFEAFPPHAYMRCTAHDQGKEVGCVCVFVLKLALVAAVCDGPPGARSGRESV